MHIPWYKDAIVYGLDVKTFCDSNGDGIGDFPGLTSRLSYLADLGVTCLWLLPFYPSPLRDNGYDVADYYNVDPRLGTLDDFKTFLREARQWHLHVIVDLVANHTSDEHPWFQAARQDKNSPYRDYYVWADQPPPNTGDMVIFPGVEDSTWEYDEAAGAYYWHYFYKFQPDLNHHNPKVREEFCRIMEYWLDLGVDGFRIDAAPLLISWKGTADPRRNPEHAILREMREFVSRHKRDAVLVAEADDEPEKLDEYFGQGEEMHMLVNFLLASDLFLAFARHDAQPLSRLFKRLPPIPESAEWLNFLRNLDELTLERLPDSERQEVYRTFGPDKTMQIYNRGIRRRLAPMLDGDEMWLRLAWSLVFSLPGVPLVVYGDEIGMGEDITLPERNAVRTPMQWSDEVNAGFSSAPGNKLIRPVVQDGAFDYRRLNVAAQHLKPESMLSWMKRLIRQRRQLQELGRGEVEFISSSDSRVFAHACNWSGQCIVAVHNLSNQACRTRLEFDRDVTRFVDVWTDSSYPTLESWEIELARYGYRWLQQI